MTEPALHTQVIGRIGKTTYVLQKEGFFRVPGGGVADFQFLPRKELFLATSARQIPSQVVAQGVSIAEAGSARTCAGEALPVAAKAHNIMEVHRMLAHPSEDITRKMAEAMRITTVGQWGSCQACLQVKTKRHAVPKMTDERVSVKG